MNELTKAQEEILKALWKIETGAVSDVLDALPEPKPAYNTVATVLKVLENKKYVSHKTYGKTNVYYALISKSKYAGFHIKNLLRDMYDNSLKQMVSPFLNSNKINLNDLEELKSLIDKEIENKKSG
jgi:predicted transcriptional regulator